MSGFDERPVYFSDAFGSEEQTDEREVNRIRTRKRFRKFFANFMREPSAIHTGDQNGACLLNSVDLCLSRKQASVIALYLRL